MKHSMSLGARLDNIGMETDAAIRCAELLYPPGTRCGVMLSSRQVKPSPATIRGARIYTYNFGDGTKARVEIRVEMDRYKSHRSRFVGVSVDSIRAGEFA